jgi:hypothetical protein
MQAVLAGCAAAAAVVLAFVCAAVKLSVLLQS